MYFAQCLFLRCKQWLSIMHSPDKGVETIAELIARLVCEHEARQAARGKKLALLNTGMTDTQDTQNTPDTEITTV